MGRYRHFRRNPTITDSPGKSKLTFTVSEARAYLIKASCMSEREQELNVDEILEAQKVVNRADKRNKRRKRNRLRKRGVDVDDCSDLDTEIDISCGPRTPLRDLNLDCLKALQKRKEVCGNGRSSRPSRASTFTPDFEGDEEVKVAKYEECFGPEGELIRFKIHYNKAGDFVKRTRTRNEPQIGDIVLDLTTGVKAWRITSNRRRKHPVTPAMRASYESSYIYKVRKLAAGKYASSNAANLSRFLDDIKNADGQRLKKGKKMKKRKNRKK